MTEEGNKPRRIQRKRTKGWKMPPNTVYVGRPTIWGNPWRISSVIDALARYSPQEAVENYRKWLTVNQAGLERYRVNLSPLRGKNLACWCPIGEPCHADVLLEIANS